MALMFFRNLRIGKNQFDRLFRHTAARNHNDYRKIIGEREIVGNGPNSQPYYLDSLNYPFPAIRFQESTPDILALREKEKGDWRSLSIDEKRMLYRASFCQTFAEMTAPTGEWKSVIGFALIWVSGGLWLYMIMKKLWNTELPDSYTEENQQAQLKRMLDLEVNPMTGLASKWDYANAKWK